MGTISILINHSFDVSTQSMSLIDPTLCPLCGKQNHCAVTLQQDPSTCWCHQPDIHIDSELLAKLPEEARGKACICKQCVEHDLQHQLSKGSSEQNSVSSDKHLDSFFGGSKDS